MALAFRDSDGLQVIVRSGLCPADVLAHGARVAHVAGGGVILAPDKALSKAALAKLHAAGVVVDAALPTAFRAVRCWAEALPPTRVARPEIPALVLLVTRSPAQLVELAAELVRLGCDRQELMIAGQFGVIRVVDPPTYSVVRALDREDGLRVFAPDPAGQETVWTELGFRHPLADHLRAEAGTLLLVAPDRWVTLPDRDWLGLDAALELAVPGDQRVLAPGKLGARRKIELRLSAGRRDVPSLWVLRHGGVAAIDRLLAYLPEDVVARLTFAVSGELVIVRARTGRHPPPDLALEPTTGGAEEYAPLAQMPDVYAPAGAIIEPPLRRERLRTILGIESREVMWLARVGRAAAGEAASARPQANSDAFRVERIADAAFTPLAEWADYVIHASAAALVPWMRASTFEFAPFVSTGLEWTSAPPVDDPPDDAADTRKRKRAGRGGPVTVPEGSAPVTRLTVPKPTVVIHAGEAPVAQVAIDAELVALESEFVALDAPGDAPERLALLERLALVYTRLDRRRDAGLCFARAAWEDPSRMDTWVTAELRRASPKVAVAKALVLTEPTLDDVRLVAVLAARGDVEIAAGPHRVQRWLDDHDGELDARTLWLARAGLAGLVGGDALGLAHTRDRILSRLAGGLPVERELPAFLRLAGRSGALGNASGEHLATALEALAVKLDKTRRKRSPVEAPAAYTAAYVGLILAHGFARVAKHARARTLVDDSRNALAPVATDPVHAYLVAAFAARIDQAIAGLPLETPLPDPVAAQLAALDRFNRYKVDRLRQASQILEPHERPDAIGAFSLRLKDSRGSEFDALREIAEPAQRAKAVAKLVDAAAQTPADRERLVDGIFDVLLELPEAAAVPLLVRTWPLVDQLDEPRRAPLYAEALVVAGHFGRTELVPELLERLGVAIRVVAAEDLQRVLQHSLRALRRIGLRGEIAELLGEVERALPAKGTDTLRARLALASGLAYLGVSERALPIFDQARKALGEPGMLVPARLDVVRALALAYAQAPLASALGGISELSRLLADITDSYGTNTHYCLSVLHFVESLVLGITSDDLALGEAGRRFVEDDEHLIRRRLHRDLGGTS